MNPVADPPTAATARSLDHLFDPRSIAIVGASDNPDKYGNWLAQRALRGSRPAYLVNPARPTVLGVPTVPTLRDADGPVDLVVIAVPAAGFAAAVQDALAVGARAIVAITSGLGELGGEHRRSQQNLVGRIRKAGAVLLGPNCFGLLDHSTGLDVCANDLPSGSVALISQSGNVAIDIAGRLASYDLGVSRFVSVGNQSDIDVAELVYSCVEHDATAMVALYCDGFTDGRRFARAAARAAAAGKPVVLLTVGRGAGSVRAAASHTGSLVTSAVVTEAMCAAAGIEQVASPAQMAHLLQAFARTTPPKGRRVGVLADGGGHAALASDALETHGLTVEPFTPATRAALAVQLPASAGTSNPVDIAGAGEKDIDCFCRISTLMLASDELDSVVLSGYFGGYREYSDVLGAKELEVARDIASEVSRRNATFIAQIMFDRSPAAQELRAGGVAVYRDMETAAWALERITAHEAAQPSGIPATPTSEPAVRAVGYWPARRHLTAAGIEFVPAAEVATLADLTRAADSLQGALVLKALAQEHKSDSGGVVLNLETRAQLLEAWHDLTQRLAPPTCSLEQMADLTDATEIIVGTRQDPAFGTIVLVGLGGIHVEQFRDTRCALGPVSPHTARTLLTQLRGAPILNGARGRPAVDTQAAAVLISKLSHFAAAHPELREIECNPVAVTPHGATALDARMVTQSRTAGSGPAVELVAP